MEAYINNLPTVVVILLLLVGFLFLIKGADYFVEGSGSVAKQFNVPSLIIGMTIVAMGTSLPETSVSVNASILGKNAMAVSNAIGSNIFNLIVVIGVCALMTNIEVDEITIKRDIPISAICSAVLMALGIIHFGDPDNMVLGQIDGSLLLISFCIYLLYMIRRAKKSMAEGGSVEDEEEIEILPIWKSIIFIVGGAAAIAFGGDLTVDTASCIALRAGMSETLVGLTIVAIGTSLPELVTSIVATRKNEIGMALGNAIGSNIFNFMMVLGIASAISPITFMMENIIDLIVILVFTVVIWIVVVIKKKLTRIDGIFMLLGYLCYTVYIIARK